MSYVTKDTTWPTAVPLDPAVKSLIDRFYSLADDTSPEAGPRMASEIFTEDAKLITGAGELSGHEGMHDASWAFGIFMATNGLLTPA